MKWFDIQSTGYHERNALWFSYYTVVLQKLWVPHKASGTAITLHIMIRSNDSRKLSNTDKWKTKSNNCQQKQRRCRWCVCIKRQRWWASVPHGRQMPCDDIQSLNGIFGDLVKVTWQGLQQHLETDHRHPLQRHLERLIFPLTRQSHLQIHLKMKGGEEGTARKRVRGQRERQKRNKRAEGLKNR